MLIQFRPSNRGVVGKACRLLLTITRNPTIRGANCFVSVKVSERVWKDTTQSGVTLLVLLALADHANDEGVCWPSQSTLAARCRCGIRSVKLAIQTLVEKEDIEVLKQGGTFKNGKYTHSIYSLKKYLPSGAKKTPLPESSGANDDTGAVQNLHPNRKVIRQPEEEVKKEEPMTPEEITEYFRSKKEKLTLSTTEYVW